MALLEEFALALTATETALQERIDAAVPAVLLDAAGAWIAGRAAGESRTLDAEALGPLGTGLLDTVARAVAATRSTETDDIHLASCITPGAIVVPTALLLAGALAAPADRVRRAIAAGYTAMIRFGESVRGPEILYRGLWPTFLAAPFGAAAAVAVLAGLDAKRTADALAIALTQISGAAGQGSASNNPRWLLAGLAARNGCVAALAARKGFSGDRQLLDGDWLSRTHGIAFDGGPMREADPAAALGEISRKPFCAARQTIGAVEAFTQIVGQGLDRQSITGVRVHVPGVYRAMIARAPLGRQDRIASVAYLLALAALRPDDLLDVERPDLGDPRLSEFLPRVEAVADPALDRLYPRRWPARVEVELAGGTRHVAEIEIAYGDPERPMSEADLLAKFRRLAEPVIGEASALEVASLCRNASESPGAIERLGLLLESPTGPSKPV